MTAYRLTAVDQVAPVDVMGATAMKKAVADLDEQPYVVETDGQRLEFATLGDLEAWAATLNEPPVAAFTFTKVGQYVGDTFVFSTVGTVDAEGGFDSASVDWRDGSPLEQLDPLSLPTEVPHVYRAAGAFTPVLKVVDLGGLSAEAPAVVTVQVAPDTLPPEPPWTPGPEGHFDTVPDFAANPDTIWKDGQWSNGAPVPESVAVIADGSVYTNAPGTTLLAKVLRFDGTLEHKGAVWAHTIVNGATKGGQILSYPGAEFVIRDLPLDLVTDPFQWGGGLLCWSRWHTRVDPATLPTPYLRHVGAIPAGATQLPLEAPPQNWEAGGRLVLPDSTQPVWRNTPDLTRAATEEVIVKSVTNNVVTLMAPTKFAHPANAKDGRGPHVAYLNRPIVVRSENPLGTRGHVVLGDKADIQLRGVVFRDLGRTSAMRPLDSTALDEQGNVAKVGTNQIGRYALHCHHLHPRFVAEGLPLYVLEDLVVERATKWSITLHGTHYGSVRRNVCYDFEGAGIMVEDAGSSYNYIERNFVCKSKGRGGPFEDRSGIGSAVGFGPGSDTAFEGSGIWTRGGNNYVNENVVAAVLAQGLVNNGYYNRGGLIPLRPDWSHHDPTTFVVYGSIPGYPRGVNKNIPFLQCDRNEVYGIGGVPYWNTWGGSMVGVDHTLWSEFVYRDNSGWHCMMGGFETWHQGNVTCYNFTFDNDPVASAKAATWSRTSKGLIFGQSYEAWKMTFIGGRITGCHIGIVTPGNPLTNLPTVIKDMHFETLLLVHCAHTHGRNRHHVFQADVSCTALNLPLPSGAPITGPAHALMTPQPKVPPVYDKQVAIMSKSEIRLRVNGQTYRPWWDLQHKDVVVPQTVGEPWRGYPEAGLTNEQGLAKYGYCTNGELMPADAVTDGRVVGGKVTP